MEYNKTSLPVTVLPQSHPVWLSGNKTLFEHTGGKRKGTKKTKKTQKKKSRKNKTRHRKTGRH